MKEKQVLKHRVVTFLDRQELDFLDEVGKDILFSEGMKVPRATILKHIVDKCLRENHHDLIKSIVNDKKKGDGGE